ncbi:MAG TPA: FAD-dependent oxidoreductase, partial [Pseudomonas sp.]|nr:FAD-dependent oxidoreductase [Pseudomonas sp.]
MNALNNVADGDAAPLKFRSLGGWVERPADLQPTLQGHAQADVIVIGAGFAGLSTALELKALGADVMVLEQEFAGFGASGRNAGYLLGSMGIEYDMFVKRVGVEQATQFVRLYDEAVPYVEGRFKTLGIDCDYNPSGVLRAGVHSSQEKRLRENMALGQKLGATSRFVDGAEMRARGIPPAFLFASEQCGGTLNPGKYIGGLRRAAIEARVKLYERTPLL